MNAHAGERYKGPRASQTRPAKASRNCCCRGRQYGRSGIASYGYGFGLAGLAEDLTDYQGSFETFAVGAVFFNTSL